MFDFANFSKETRKSFTQNSQLNNFLGWRESKGSTNNSNNYNDREKQSNGPSRNSGAEMTLLEKMHHRKEEEERRDRDRKQAAQKKFQELDEKSKHKDKDSMVGVWC